MFKEDFGTDIPPVVGVMNLFFPTFIITRPEMLEELFVTKAKNFDKDQIIAKGLVHVLGESTIF